MFGSVLGVTLQGYSNLSQENLAQNTGHFYILGGILFCLGLAHGILFSHVTRLGVSLLTIIKEKICKT